MISAAVGRGGETMISAQTIEAFWNAVEHAKPLSVGLNCSLGPDLMYPFLEELSEKANVAISCYPNAGLPNPLSPTGFDLGPADMARYLGEFARGRADQYCGRMLRQYAGAYCGDCQGAGRAASAEADRSDEDPAYAERGQPMSAPETSAVMPALEAAAAVGIAAVYAAGRRLHHDRRADQCGRFAEVREAGQGRANSKKR